MKFHRIFLLFLLIFLSACPAKVWKEGQPVQTFSFPWETWTDGMTLDHVPLSSRFSARADDQFRLGEFSQALQNYYVAIANAITADEIESLKLRIASTLLANDQPADALEILSKHYKAEGRTVNYVRSESATVFAYIYGRLGNFNQSLAWFSQGIRSAKNSSQTAAAEEGVALLLARISDKDFYDLKKEWEHDLYLPKLFALENSRRLIPGNEIYAFRSNPRFWEAGLEKEYQPIESGVKTASKGKGIAVLLPLSGRYAKFGRNVKQGIELALVNNKDVFFSFEDTESSPAWAEKICHELGSSGKYSVILGPLLYAPSEAVRKCALQYEIRLISFTKKSDFMTGPGVYQLGVTVEDQISSLVKSTYNNLGLKKYAVVFPVDESAQKFVQVFRSELRRLGLRPVFEYSYHRYPIPDFTDLNQEIEAYNPQAILILDDINMASRVSSAIGDRLITRVKLLGTAEWANSDLLSRSASALKGAIFVSPYFSEGGDLNKKFEISYNKIYGIKPDFLAAQGYDAAIVASSLLRRMQNGQSWSQAIASIKQYQGLTGHISFSSKESLKRKLKVVEYHNSGLRELNRSATPSFVYRGNNELKEEKEKN